MRLALKILVLRSLEEKWGIYVIYFRTYHSDFNADQNVLYGKISPALKTGGRIAYKVEE